MTADIFVFGKKKENENWNEPDKKGSLLKQGTRSGHLLPLGHQTDPTVGLRVGGKKCLKMCLRNIWMIPYSLLQNVPAS